MATTRFYFAGKISKHGWRETIIGSGPDIHRGAGTVWKNAILGQFDYTGPFFVAMGHGETHGDNQHGAMSGYDIHSMDAHEAWFTREAVRDTCLAGVAACNIVFAWIDDPEAYGTLVELGYAKALGKEIWIAGPRRLPDLWFAETIATRQCYWKVTALAAFLEMLPDELKPKPKRLPIPSGLRFMILRRDNCRCQLCGACATDGAVLHIDHRVPVMAGGSNDPENLWVLCRDCNLGKGAQELEIAPVVRDGVKLTWRSLGND